MKAYVDPSENYNICLKARSISNGLFKLGKSLNDLEENANNNIIGEIFRLRDYVGILGCDLLNYFTDNDKINREYEEVINVFAKEINNIDKEINKLRKTYAEKI